MRVLRAVAWPAVAAGTFLFWAVFGATLVNPVVVDDEVRFLITASAGAALAQAVAMHAAVQSSGALLYPALVHALGALGLPLEAGAKLANAALFTGAAVLLAVKSRGLADGRRSSLVVAALLLAPLGAYAALIMPECLYFSLAAAAAAVLMGVRGAGPDREGLRAAAAGALLGVATVVKPHGMLAVAALPAALLVRGAAVGRVRRGLVEAGAAGLAAAAAFLLAKVATTSPDLAGRDLLGPDYRAQLAALAAGPARWWEGLRLAGAYLAAVLALLAPAVVLLAAELLRRGRAGWTGAEGRARTAGLWTLFLLAGLILAVPLVLATEADRRHLRYLDFLFPILLAVAARVAPEPGRRLRWAASGVWVAAAAALVLQGGLRPLGVDSPELFFLYDGREFGRFGLGGAARPLFALAVLAGAGAMALGRVRWTTAQAGVLLACAAASIPNVWSFDHALSAANAPERAVGKAALELCGRGGGDVVALGTPKSFVPLYGALHVLKRPAPLLLSKHPETVRAAVTPGACLLTTLPTPEPRWEKLAGSPLITLYRARP